MYLNVLQVRKGEFYMNNEEVKMISNDITQRVNEPSHEDYIAQIIDEVEQLKELLTNLDFSSKFPRMPKRMLFNLVNDVSSIRGKLSNLHQMTHKSSP